MKFISSLVALLCLAMPLTVNAQRASQADALVAQLNDNAAKFMSLIKKAQHDGDASELLTPRAEKLLSQTIAKADQLIARPMTVKDLPQLVKITGAVNKISVSMMLFRPKGTHLSKGSVKMMRAEVQKMAFGNLQTFRRYFFLIQPFTLRASAKSIPLINELIFNLPPTKMTDIRRKGAIRTRKGIRKTFAGAIMVALAPATSPTYRLKLLSILSKTAHTYASALRAPVRQNVAAKLRVAAKQMERPYKTYITKIARALETTEGCEGLCEIHLSASPNAAREHTR